MDGVGEGEVHIQRSGCKGTDQTTEITKQMQVGSRQSATSLSAIDVDTPPQLFDSLLPSFDLRRKSFDDE